MDLSVFRAEFSKAVNAGETLSFFCECSIIYSGRAEAELREGGRLVIIKADKSIIVHQPEGSNPVNYMKPDSSLELVEAGGRERKGLLLKSYNQKYKDYLDVFITRVFSFHSAKLEDGRKLVLVGSERDMSDMIKENPGLISKDFAPLSREEHTKFGFIDVFGHDKNGNLVIVECKRYTAGFSAVQQLRRYVEKIVELKGVDKKNVKGVVAAPDIAKNAEAMLKQWGFSFKRVNPPKRLEKFNKDQKSLGDY